MKLEELRQYKVTLEVPEGNLTLEKAWRYHRAVSLAARGAVQEAVAEYKKLIELDPEEPCHYEDLAELYRSAGMLKEAVVVLLALGEVYERAGQREEAEAAVKMATELEEEAGDEPPGRGGGPPAQAAALPPVPAVAGAAPAAVSTVVKAKDDTGANPGQSTDPGAGPSFPVQASAVRKQAPEAAQRGVRDPIGAALLKMGLVNEEQVRHAEEVNARTGEPVGRVLVRAGVITEEDLAKAVGVRWGCPFVSLSGVQVDPEAVRLVPQHIAVRHKLFGYAREGGRLVVAVVDPVDLLGLDSVRMVTGMELDVRVATEEDVVRAINRHYNVESALEKAVEVEEGEPGEEEVSVDRLREMVDEAPVVKLVNVILDQAIREGASDIHIEPHRNGLHVRYRIDGVLHDVMSPPKNLKAALVSRIKIVANLDIAERRRPQDGRIHRKVDGRDIDLRVSTLPTMFGEKVVLRILDQSNALISLNRLGMASDVQAKWEELASKPYGMILVTGPTGSGKTTTLYATLSKINTLDKNIITVEDPVEYQLPRINQVQVNPKAGLTFATGLRSILRQDPDVIMVGEIRDRETAEIAVQAALTGHLVLSTLHTNDAPSAFTRLVDMGIEPFLISSSVIGVLAQRLARCICPKCKEAYRPPKDALRRLSEELAEEEDLVLYRGTGCDHCRHTGYKGRTGVHELLVVSERVKDLVNRRASSAEVLRAARAEGFRTMRDDGIRKVLEGVTTMEEILRVVFVG
jgi:type IV pilus assembly protein PilB